MPDPISRTARPTGPTPRIEEGNAGRPSSRGSFPQVLQGARASPGLALAIRSALASVASSEREVDRSVRRLSAGADLSSAELIALQTSVYRATQQAELLARALDRASDAIREITQVRV